ncbi:integrase catalytic domain-containing protein [Trichonephila clavipes]|nr:integrase catalytic domain-containing protein [Trichonephila clavipes]
MLNYIEQEHIEVCQLETSNENTIHYLPHHAVKKTTNLRIAFDASSYDLRMPSLNDTLEVGLLHLTVGCRFRFRMRENAITSTLWHAAEKEPFDSTGIYFVGPVYVRGTNCPKKSCIALFTCSTTRALPIELVLNFTTERFLMDFHRFGRRRRLPHTLYTDNTTTFKAANKELITFWNTLSSKFAPQSYVENIIRWGNSLYLDLLGGQDGRKGWLE